MEGICNYNEK